MKKLRFLSLIFLLLTLSLTGCEAKQLSDPNINGVKSIKVYTTIYPLYDFTRKIGGDELNITNILPAGADPHSFEPSTKLVANLMEADLLITNGLGMEPYLDNLQDVLPSSLTVLNTSIDVALLENTDAEDHQEGEEKGHEHGQYDPHVWLDPANALKQGESILKALIASDPINKPLYETNFAAFKTEITALDQEYKVLAGKCRKDIIIVSHEAFGYMAHAYGFSQVAVMGLSSEAEPTPGKLREIIELVKTHDLSYIFLESLISPKIAETIARETNVKILSINTLGSLTEADLQNGKEYFSVMRGNLTGLKAALEYMP